jgi:hypothetical protein
MMYRRNHAALLFVGDVAGAVEGEVAECEEVCLYTV